MPEEKSETPKKRGRPKAGEKLKPKSKNEKFRMKDDSQASPVWKKRRELALKAENNFMDAVKRESDLWKEQHPGVDYNHRKIQLDEKDLQTREAFADATRGAILSLKVGVANAVTNDEELQLRLDSYFIACQQCVLMPSLETMALAIGKNIHWVERVISGQTVGFSVNTAEILLKAQTILRSVLSELALKGKINTVAYIFYSKNNLGMVDEKRLTVSAEVNQKSPEQLIAESKMLMDDIIDADYDDKDG